LGFGISDGREEVRPRGISLRSRGAGANSTRSLFGVAIAEPPAAGLLYGAEAPCPLERACHAFGGQAHARKRERVAGQPITLGTNIERRANTNGMKR
jgi:hypothetical protein